MQRPLCEEDFRPDRPLARLGTRLLLVSETQSTNSLLLNQAADLPDGTVAHAELQRAGRGRLGRAWHAPRGSSILLSVLLIEPIESSLAALGTLAAALAACEAIDAATECRASVRWPNDVVIGGRKTGGVLAESRLIQRNDRGGARSRAVIIGIGINCLQQRGHFPPELSDKATSLEIESHSPVRREALAAALVDRLDAWLAQAAGPGGSNELRRAWLARCEDIGSRVQLRQDGLLHQGTVLDITDDGDLLVALEPEGRRRFEAATTTRAW